MTIELERSLELRKYYLEKDSTQCDHKYEKEYFSGMHTGDFACIKCGNSISESAYIKLIREKKR